LNPFSLLNNLITAFRLWHQYGGGVEKAITILQQIDACTGRADYHVIAEVEKILLQNGIDVSAMLAAIGGAIDLTTLKGMQTALNALGCTPALTATGILDAPTLAAVSAFQKSQGLTGDSIPGPQTIAAMTAALTAKNIPTI
jgi:murein L,D-transpeptidase YcbB/YkuD